VLYRVSTMMVLAPCRAALTSRQRSGLRRTANTTGCRAKHRRSASVGKKTRRTSFIALPLVLFYASLFLGRYS